VREKLNLLLEKHCVSIKGTAGLLGEHLKRARDNEAERRQAIEDATALAHQLKGSSGTAGFHDICVATTALYAHLTELSASGGAPPGPGVDQAMELYEKLSGAARAAHPQTSTLYLVMP
jgi:HPt (histidine-containing phosphotransfer) domain-containing protein